MRRRGRPMQCIAWTALRWQGSVFQEALQRSRAILQHEARQASSTVHVQRAVAVQQSVDTLVEARNWTAAAQVVELANELLLTPDIRDTPMGPSTRFAFVKQLGMSFGRDFFQHRQLSVSWKTVLEQLVDSANAVKSPPLKRPLLLVDCPDVYRDTFANTAWNSAEETERMVHLLSTCDTFRVVVTTLGFRYHAPAPVSIPVAISSIAAACLSTLVANDNKGRALHTLEDVVIGFDHSRPLTVVGIFSLALRKTEDAGKRVRSLNCSGAGEGLRTRALVRGAWTRADAAIARMLSWVTPAVLQFQSRRQSISPLLYDAVLDDLVSVLLFLGEELVHSTPHPYVHFRPLIVFAIALHRAGAQLMKDSVVAPLILQLMPFVDVVSPPGVAFPPLLDFADPSLRQELPRSLLLLHESAVAGTAAAVVNATQQLLALCEEKAGLPAARGFVTALARQANRMDNGEGDGRRDPMGAWQLALSLTLAITHTKGWSFLDPEIYSRLVKRVEKAGRWVEAARLVFTIASGATKARFAELHPYGPPVRVAEHLAARLNPADQLQALLLLDTANNSQYPVMFPFIHEMAKAGMAEDVARAWSRLLANMKAHGTAPALIPAADSVGCLLSLQWANQWVEALTLCHRVHKDGVVTLADALVVGLTVGLREGNVELVTAVLVGLAVGVDPTQSMTREEWITYTLHRAFRWCGRSMSRVALYHLVVSLLGTGEASRHAATNDQDRAHVVVVVDCILRAFDIGLLPRPSSLTQDYATVQAVGLTVPYPLLFDVAVQLPGRLQELFPSRTVREWEDVMMGKVPPAVLKVVQWSQDHVSYTTHHLAPLKPGAGDY